MGQRLLLLLFFFLRRPKEDYLMAIYVSQPLFLQFYFSFLVGETKVEAHSSFSFENDFHCMNGNTFYQNGRICMCSVVLIPSSFLLLDLFCSYLCKNSYGFSSIFPKVVSKKCRVETTKYTIISTKKKKKIAEITLIWQSDFRILTSNTSHCQWKKKYNSVKIHIAGTVCNQCIHLQNAYTITMVINIPA